MRELNYFYLVLAFVAGSSVNMLFQLSSMEGMTESSSTEKLSRSNHETEPHNYVEQLMYKYMSWYDISTIGDNDF